MIEAMPQRQLTTYQAVISQARAFRNLRTFLVETLKEHDLTLTEWLMIGTVIDGGKEGVRVSDLADTLGVEMPVITNLANRAVATGWVTRVVDPNDRRAKLIRATREGGEKTCDIEGILRGETSTWLEDIDASMLKSYLTIVGLLATKDSLTERK
jgi:DNA-binding MarR family transcriptional regulator